MLPWNCAVVIEGHFVCYALFYETFLFKQRTFAFHLTTVVVKYFVLKESDFPLISRIRTLIFEIILLIISVVKAGANGVRKV